MSHKRLKIRCPHSIFLSTGYLENYVFKFNKKSKLGIGSGKGNIISTNNIEDVVWGVIFSISKTEEKILDEVEGLGKGYEKTSLNIKKENGELIKAITYIAIDPIYIDDNEIPFDWYKNHCITGAMEHQLTQEYIEYLNSFNTKKDNNNKRVTEETGIYNNP